MIIQTTLLYIIILVISHMLAGKKTVFIYIYSKQLLKYGKPRSLLELSERLFLCSGNGWCVGVGLSFLVCIQFQKKTCVSSLNSTSLELLWMVAKSCTTLDGWTPIDNGMFTTYELVIRISQPSTVVQSLSSICEISDKIWGFKGFVFQCLFVLEVCETNWNERCVISSLRHQVCFF